MFIQLKHVSVTFKGAESVQALNDIELNIEKGEWVNILGPSGSGKTTLLNLIGGMVIPSSGAVEINGRNLAEYKEDEIQEYRRSKIGYIFQDFKLFDQFTVLENVMLPALPYEKKKKIEEKAISILDQLQMSHRVSARPGQLSGGEKQRTAIARALVMEPEILLCDEPTGNLDEENRENILQVLSTLYNKGMTILLVTHDLEVAKWGSKEIYIRNGKIQKMITVS